jgi:galactofuranose transport system substrate-binding protein
MKRKIIMLSLCLMMVIAMAIGCTPSGSSTSAAATTAAATTVAATPEASTADKQITLGVSYAFTSVPALQYHVELYKKYSADRGWKLVFLDANSKAEQQVADIESLIQQKVDYMIVFPVDATAGLNAIHEVTAAHIPLVFFSYKVDGAVWGTDYLAIGTGDNKAQGSKAADFMKENWETFGFSGPVKYINLAGPVANSAGVDRSAGFAEKAKEYGFTEVATQVANWSRSEAQQIVTNIIQSSGGDFNAIYSGNEEMLIGAIVAMQQAGMDPKKVFNVGVDATKEVCGMIKDGLITGEVFYSHEDLVGGQFKIFDNYAKGIKPANEITGLTLDVINKSNVDDYLAGKGSGLIIN